MIYSEVRERVVFGVIRRAVDPPSLNRLRAVFDAAFPQVNSQVAEEYAADENKRNELRAVKALTFVSGSATLPASVLLKYLKDCTLTVAANHHYSYRPEYSDFLRGGDRRLGIWSTNGNTIYANTPSPVTAVSGAASFSCICSPDIPVTESDPFVAPPDFVADFIDAFQDYILSGKTFSQAAATT